MPIPKPNPDKETQNEYITRCIKTLSKEDWQKFEDGVKDARKLKVKSVSL